MGGGDGIVRVFYDPNKSHNGAKLCVGKYLLNQKIFHNITYVGLQNFPKTTKLSWALYFIF